MENKINSFVLDPKLPEAVELIGDNLIVNKSSGNILNNPRAENLTQNISVTVYNNSTAQGFSIDSDGHSLHFSSDDLLRMNKPIPIVDSHTCCVSTIKADLMIKKPDILGHSAWSFRYNDKNIEARINDDTFLDYIDEGNFTIKQGSYITADLEISSELNAEGFADDKPPKYTILKVYGGIKNDIDNQLKLIPGK